MARSDPTGAPGEAPPPGLARRLRVIAVVFLVEIAFLAGLYALALAHAPPPRMTFLDGLALPGAAAEIGVVLERIEPILGLGSFLGTRVAFTEIGAPGGQPPSPAGTVAADAAGRALLQLPAGEPGRRRFAARLEEPAGARGGIEAATGILEAAPAEKPLLFVCFPPPGAPRSPGGTAAATPLRPEEALRELAAGRAVVYLAGAPLAAAQARSRFGEGGLPEGPVLLAPGSHAGEMTSLDVAGALKGAGLERRPAKHWAIARTRGEAADFALASIPVVVVGAEAAGKDGRIHFVEDWTAARRVIPPAGP